MSAARPKAPAAENRRARYDYQIEETVEAGIMLTGSEVKSLRAGHVSIAESYATIDSKRGQGEAWLINGHIAVYAPASLGGKPSHEERRPRKLLLRRREIDRLAGAIQRDGMTLIPLSLRFNDRGIAKMILGLARGKKNHDKRETEKARDWDRQKARLLRERG